MDPDRFDALSRALSGRHDRRGLPRLLGALGLAGGLSAHAVEDVAARLRKGGTRCTTDSQCRTGKCLGNNTCSCSRAFPSCKQPTNACKQAVCNVVKKRCVIRNKPAGSPCPSDGDLCTSDVCDGGGQCIHSPSAHGTSCGDGKACCGGSCVDLRTDPANCGRCGKVCPGGSCVNGACECTSGPGLPCPDGCDQRACYTHVSGSGGGICDADGDVCTGRISCDDDSDCPVGSACLAGCSAGSHCSLPCG